MYILVYIILYILDAYIKQCAEYNIFSFLNGILSNLNISSI